MKLCLSPALLLFAATTALAQTAPATLPAVPTYPADDPRSAVTTFMSNMISGDEKATFDSMFFSTPKSSEAAHAMLGTGLAHARLSRAMAAAFPNSDQRPDGPSADDIKDMTSDLNAATITRTGDTATIKMPHDNTFTAVLKDKVWKVDFDATLKEMKDAPSAAEVEQAGKMIKAIDSVTADVIAKKFATAGEAMGALLQRTDAVSGPNGMGGAPTPPPATRP